MAKGLMKTLSYYQVNFDESELPEMTPLQERVYEIVDHYGRITEKGVHQNIPDENYGTVHRTVMELLEHKILQRKSISVSDAVIEE